MANVRAGAGKLSCENCFFHQRMLCAVSNAAPCASFRPAHPDGAAAASAAAVRVPPGPAPAGGVDVPDSAGAVRAPRVLRFRPDRGRGTPSGRASGRWGGGRRGFARAGGLRGRRLPEALVGDEVAGADGSVMEVDSVPIEHLFDLGHRADRDLSRSGGRRRAEGAGWGCGPVMQCGGGAGCAVRCGGADALGAPDNRRAGGRRAARAVATPGATPPPVRVPRVFWPLIGGVHRWVHPVRDLHGVG